MHKQILHLITGLMLCLLTLTAHAAERLDYVVSLKGAITLSQWKGLADASIITDRDDRCFGSACSRTVVEMSSKNYRLLESLAPTRFFYSSAYIEKPLSSVAFEKRQKKSSKKYQPYGYKHSLSVRSSDSRTIERYEIASDGEPLPQRALAILSPLPGKAMQPMVKKQRNSPLKAGAVDRWALIQHLRRDNLDDSYSKKFSGTDGHHSLTFHTRVKQAETLMIAGKEWSVWKLLVEEENVDDKTMQPPLYLWISQTEERLPLQLEMQSDQGRIRFQLTGYSL